MNEKWLEDIRRKALGYAEEPQGIDRPELERRMAAAFAARRRRVVALWGSRLAAAAAVAALAVPLAGLLPDSGQEQPVADAPRHVAAAGGGDAAPAAPAVGPAPAAAMAQAAPRRPLAAAHDGLPGGIAPAAAPGDAAAGDAQPENREGSGGEPRQRGGAARAEAGLRPRTPRHAVAAPAQRKRPAPKVSAFVANAAMGGSSATAYRAMLPMANPIGYYTEAFGAGESDAALLQSEAAHTDVDHRPPLRFGVLVSLPVSRRWAVETGLVYSYLHSEISSGNATLRTETTQRLHYVGLPVAATFTAWSGRSFSLYAKAGGMVEKMVGGSADTRIFSDGMEEQSATDHVSIKPLQFSVGGAIGAEWRFAGSVGAYVEPGVSYTFDNGSSVPTYYADRQLSFSLSVGLRVGLGRR